MWARSRASAALALARSAGCGAGSPDAGGADSALACGSGVDSPANEGATHVDEPTPVSYRANPPAYDRRWMALHGMQAIRSGLAAKEGRSRERGDITIPQQQWAVSDEENRVDMLQKMKARMPR